MSTGNNQVLFQWPADVAPIINAKFGSKQGLDNQHIDGGGGGYSCQAGISKCLNAGGMGRQDWESETMVISGGYKVRRLTPLECERLMGFPDGFTDIMPDGKTTPDSHRYKALGNSMAVNVMQWIGHRIQEVEDGKGLR